MAEINNNGSNTPIQNYAVSTRKGKIYRSSKTEEPGFEKVELDSGAVVYHKYVDGLCGKISYLSRQEKEIVGNDGKKKKLDSLKMFVNDGVTTCALDLKTYGQEWKLMIKHLYNLDFSKEVCLGFYKKEVGEKSYMNCYVKYSGEETADGKAVYPEWLDTTPTDKGGQVPPPVKNKKDEWDWTDNDIWHLDKMNELIQRFIEHKNSNTPAAKQSEAKSNQPKPQTPAQAFEPASHTPDDGKFDALPF